MQCTRHVSRTIFTKRKRTKRKTNNLQNITKKKLKVERHEAHYKQMMNSGAPEGLSVTDQLVTPVLLLLNDTNII